MEQKVAKKRGRPTYLQRLKDGKCSQHEQEAFNWLYSQLMFNRKTHNCTCNAFGEAGFLIPAEHVDVIKRLMRLSGIMPCSENKMYEAQTGQVLYVSVTYPSEQVSSIDVVH